MNPEINGIIENSGTFGNYLIKGIDEIVLADAISWWPATPGWFVLAFVISVVLAIKLFRLSRRWWFNRYRREALRQLTLVQQTSGTQFLEVVSVLPYYIKVTALQAYPRKNIAGLTGNDWLAFLDSHYTGPSFQEDVGKSLLRIAYLPHEKWQVNKQQASQLISMTRLWIATHKDLAYV
ncbi:MAG: DUF4381 domain-containing protein [Thiohalomonadales bacterium]